MKHLLPIAALIAASFCSTGAAAWESVEGKSWDAKERFMVRVRAIGVMPDESSSTSIGGRVEADSAYVPEVDFTYFFTDHIAAELIAATAPHDMRARNTTLGNLDIGEVWLLPPTLTAQYHFIPDGDFRPYVGAGLGYIIYHSENSGAMTNIKYDDGIAYALQAGIDVPLDDHWSINFDVKKLWHNVDVSINSGAVTADVDLDPWIIGVGAAYRF